MDTKPNMVRIPKLFLQEKLAMAVLIVVDTLGRFDQGPNHVQHERANKVEDGLICKVVSYDASVVINHAANHILYTKYKWHHGALYSIKKTHNRYSTTRREKYKCLGCLILNTFSPQLQFRRDRFSEAVLSEGVY